MGLLQKKETLLKFLCFIVIPVLGLLFSTADVLIIYALVLILVWENDFYTLLFFVLFSFVQNIVLTIGANSFGSFGTTLFSLSKEIMIYGCVAFSLIKKHTVAKHSLLFAPFLFSIIIGFMFSDATLYAKILSIRQLFLPFMCFFFGFIVKISKEDLKKVCKLIISLAVISSILGLIELLIVKDALWQIIPTYQYEVNKGTEFVFYNGVPLNFYTWDYYDFTHSVIRRLVSVFVDPLIAGHYLFLGFVLADATMDPGRNKSVVKALLAICSILTLSKGTYVAFAVYIGFKIVRNKSYKNIVQYIGLAVVGMVPLMIAFYEFARQFMATSSIGVHFNGLFGGFQDIKLLGNGLGNAGVITTVLSGTTETSLTSESYIGVLASQIGGIGLASFLIFFGTIIFKLIRKYKSEDNKLCYIAAILLTSIILESFFSESSIGIVGSGLYFTLAGAVLRTHLLYENTDADNTVKSVDSEIVLPHRDESEATL